MINEPETTLYAIGEPMLPGLPGVSVALCVAVATLVIAVASFLLANRAGDDRERNIGDPFGSFTLPHDLVTVYFWAALAAFVLHLAEFATLRLLGGDSSAPLFVLVVLGYVALAASAAFVVLAVRESPDRPPSVLAGVVGAIVGFFSGWAMLYSQKCADLLGADLGMTVLFILAAGGSLLLVYGVSWLVWRVGKAHAHARLEALYAERARDAELDGSDRRLPEWGEVEQLLVEDMGNYGARPVQAAAGLSRDLAHPVGGCAGALACGAIAGVLLISVAFPLEGLLLNLPLSMPVVVKDAVEEGRVDVYRVNPYAAVVSRATFGPLASWTMKAT